MPVEVPIDGKLARPIEGLLELIQEALTHVENFPIEDEANAVWAESKKKK